MSGFPVAKNTESLRKRKLISVWAARIGGGLTTLIFEIAINLINSPNRVQVSVQIPVSIPTPPVMQPAVESPSNVPVAKPVNEQTTTPPGCVLETICPLGVIRSVERNSSGVFIETDLGRFNVYDDYRNIYELPIQVGQKFSALRLK